MSVQNAGLCVSLALLFPVTTTSASDADDKIAECARISSIGDRILCLEDAIRSLSPVNQVAETPEVVDQALATESRDALSAETSAATQTATAELAAGTAVTATTAGEVPAIEETQDTPESVADDAMTEVQPELGAEQVARQNDIDEEEIRISASIVEHSIVGTGRLRLTLDNGQVWQQTGDDDDRVARRIRGDTHIAIEMWQSRSGGYRMHLLEVDRTLRVRRIR